MGTSTLFSFNKKLTFILTAFIMLSSIGYAQRTVYKPCDNYQGFNLKRDSNARVGFITALTINGVPSTASDITVKDPLSLQTDLRVFSVLQEATWNMGSQYPIQFSGQISVNNQKAINIALIQNRLQNASVTFSFVVYEYDSRMKKYFKAFHSNNVQLKGKIETAKGGQANVSIGKQRNTQVAYPENYAFSISIANAAPGQQSIINAVSDTQAFPMRW